jgi:hypothetical protein
MRFLHPDILNNNISRGIHSTNISRLVQKKNSRGKIFEMLIVIFLLFSWNPAGALRTGKNPAVYKFLGETIHVDGKSVTIYFS